MESTGRIIRSSIFTFLKCFHYFSTIPLLLLLPFSASALMISQALFQSHVSSSLPLIFHGTQFTSLVHVAGSSSESMSLFNMNLYDHQTTFMYYLFSLPFTLSSFLIAKAYIIQALNHQKRETMSLYRPMLLTHLCNLTLIIIFFVASNFLVELGLSYSCTIFPSVARLVFYSILPQILFIRNLALVVAGMDNSYKGYAAIYKACLLRKGKTSMALLLAFPKNLGLAAIESLFRFRVLRTYHSLGKFTAYIAIEGMLVAYLYSLLLVLDTICLLPLL